MSLRVTSGDETRVLRSRRFHRADAPTELALTLTGTHVTGWTREADRWVARARHDLRDDDGTGRALDTRDEAALADLRVELPDGGGTAGGFGQLGLRDVRFVTDEDGRPVRDGDALWLTATSAGPGFFDTAHTSVWRLDPTTLDLDARGRPLLPPPRPTGRLRRPRHPPRPLVRRVARGDQHVGRLRDPDDPRRSSYAVGVAGDPRRVRRRPAARHPRPRHPRAAAADRRSRLDRDLGPAPRAARRTVAGGLRQRASLLRLPPRAGRRARTSTSCGCWAPPPTGRATEGTTLVEVDGRPGRAGERRPRLAARHAGALPRLRPRDARGRAARRAVPDQPAVAHPRPGRRRRG